MLRRAIPLVVCALAVTAGSASPARDSSVCTGSCFTAPAGSGALFVFSGHGWGHGVGMSQYGAYGYAQHGATFDQILAHYYPGTTLASTRPSTIRVLLADKEKRLTIASAAPFTVKDGVGNVHALAAGAVSFGTELKLAVDGQATPQALTPPLLFVPGSGSPLTLTRPYRGRILVDVVDGRLRAVNVLGVEQYLYGVVPSEMPSNWAPEALKAQAVAARSYALATKQIAAPFDAYSDATGQVYLGFAHETAATRAAVDATKGQVLLYGGKAATTYFYSTSGGQTESSQDWRGVARPYLVSVPDPYDDISPYHDWGPVPVTARAMAKDLKLKATVTDVQTMPNASGRVAQLEIVTPTNDVSIAATRVRGALRLRSTWFDVGVMSLVPPSPSAPVPYGAKVSLSGTVRGVAGVTLEQRTAGGPWEPVAPVTPGPNGAFSITAKPSLTTDYRLATPAAAAAYVRMRVAPAVTVTMLSATRVAGMVRPLLSGAPVQVQQQAADATWATVSTGSVGADGSFSIPVQLASGSTYRVVVVPGHGFSPGVTNGQVAAG